LLDVTAWSSLKSVNGQNHASIDKVCWLDPVLELELEDIIDVDELVATDELLEVTELDEGELEEEELEVVELDEVDVDVEVVVELLLPVVEK